MLTEYNVPPVTIARQVLLSNKHVLQEPSTPMPHPLLMPLVNYALQELS